MNTLIDTSMHFVSPFETKLVIYSIAITYKKGSTLPAVILAKLLIINERAQPCTSRFPVVPSERILASQPYFGRSFRVAKRAYTSVTKHVIVSDSLNHRETALLCVIIDGNMIDIHNKFLSHFFLRSTIGHSWKYFCGDVQRVWNPETVRYAFLLNSGDAIGTFSPRGGVHSCLPFLAVAGYPYHLVQYGRSLALLVLLSRLVLYLPFV